MEHQAVQDNQCLGSGKHQRDLVNLWRKPWNEQGVASSLAYVHLEETRRHAVEPNSLLGNENLGFSYDSIPAKGPCSLTPLVAALVRWSRHTRERLLTTPCIDPKCLD